MQVLVIDSGLRNLDALRAALSICDVSSISYVPAVFIDQTQPLLTREVDLLRAKLLLGREMSPAEVGCALAHNKARRLASSSSDFTLILEDDAIVPDPVLLREMLEHVSRTSSVKSNVVINLGINRAWIPGPNNNRSRSKLRRTIGSSPLALAYIVTPVSSNELLQANTPVQYLSDWPPASVTWLRAIRPLIFHGMGANRSLISQNQGKERSQETFRFKLFRYFLIEYVIERSKYRGFGDFFRSAWLPRVRSLITHKTGF